MNLMEKYNNKKLNEVNRIFLYIYYKNNNINP